MCAYVLYIIIIGIGFGQNAQVIIAQIQFVEQLAMLTTAFPATKILAVVGQFNHLEDQSAAC